MRYPTREPVTPLRNRGDGGMQKEEVSEGWSNLQEILNAQKTVQLKRMIDKAKSMPLPWDDHFVKELVD